MKTTVTYWCNIAPAKHLVGYHASDLVVRGGIDRHPVLDETASDTAVAEWAFGYWNADGRPNGATAPSMSIGDIVEITDDDGHRYYACDRVGWVRVFPPNQLDTPPGVTCAQMVIAEIARHN